MENGITSIISTGSRWNSEDIRTAIGSEKATEFDPDLIEITPCLYAFRPYHAPTWTDINKAATQQDRGHFFSPGLVIGVQSAENG